MLPVLRPISLALLASAFAVACTVRTLQVEESRPAPGPGTRVESPVKAHLLDGTTVLYAHGVKVEDQALVGPGTRFGLRLEELGPVERVPLDSLVGMEAFRSGVNGAATAGLTLLAVAGTLGIGALLAVAIFGSCPTFYSDSLNTQVLEAEGFSYSIAPLFEARDVDRLRLRTGADGTLRLEVRNEALETHFINHLELLQVSHAPDEQVVPDALGHPLALRDLRAPAIARDRAGRQVARALTAADGEVFATDTVVLARASVTDLEDYIDLAFPSPVGGDSIGLLLRLRNSLLNTVLLYDLMLGRQGARALDWQARDLDRVGPALELGSWYAGRMGLRVLVRQGTGFREVARIRDTGPIAWKDVAVLLPPFEGDSVHLRLAFVADNWRIDRVALAAGARQAAAGTIPLEQVLVAPGTPDTAALAAMRAPDGRYLETRPGQHFTAVWRPELPASGAEQTYLLASQGYYIEWVRRAWIAEGRDTTGFRPDDVALVEAIHRWRGVQDSLEALFYASKIPVR
ncbi:MAG: hypothetical protein JNM53_13170 [Gemmatimonadetes bacterium]|nr:hypothetical protein [Gemmatimonadota bacterium]